MTIYFPQNYKHTKKKEEEEATLSPAKPQTLETKLNTLFKTCYLPSKLNCRLLLACGRRAQAAKYRNTTEINEECLSWIRTQAISEQKHHFFRFDNLRNNLPWLYPSVSVKVTEWFWLIDNNTTTTTTYESLSGYRTIKSWTYFHRCAWCLHRPPTQFFK